MAGVSLGSCATGARAAIDCGPCPRRMSPAFAHLLFMPPAPGNRPSAADLKPYMVCAVNPATGAHHPAKGLQVACTHAHARAALGPAGWCRLARMHTRLRTAAGASAACPACERLHKCTLPPLAGEELQGSTISLMLAAQPSCSPIADLHLLARLLSCPEMMSGAPDGAWLSPLCHRALPCCVCPSNHVLLRPAAGTALRPTTTACAPTSPVHHHSPCPAPDLNHERMKLGIIQTGLRSLRDPTNQASLQAQLEALCQRTVRDAALVWLALAGCALLAAAHPARCGWPG